MKTLINIALLFVLFLSANQLIAQNSQMSTKYPKTKKVDTTNTYFGTNVSDPYGGDRFH